jgi:hypothetical protein
MPRLLAIVLAALLTLGSGAALAQAGYVHDLTGTATATAAAGAARNLKIGDTVDAGETITTGERSSAVIKFEDGQIMALAANSSFRVVDYRYNKASVRDSSAVFTFLRGGLRFISGVIGSTNHSNVRVNAGGATIGLRGTDASLAIDAVTQAVVAAVNAGAIVMTTQQGSRVITAGLFSSALPNEAPTVPAPTPEATAVVRAVLDFLAAIQNLPINTPVVVQASARAAAAQAEARALAARAAADPTNQDLQRAAQESGLQAQTALANAINAAVQAYQDAIKGGAVAPDPPAPPPPPSSGAPGDSVPTPTTTTTSPTGAAGAGGGGGGTAPCTATSSSPC